jgi:hypothetical protein
MFQTGSIPLRKRSLNRAEYKGEGGTFYGMILRLFERHFLFKKVTIVI